MKVLLRSNVKPTLIPAELTTQIMIDGKDLDRLDHGSPEAKWLATGSRGWLRLWEWGIGAKGFTPWDLLITAYAALPGYLECEDDMPALLQRLPNDTFLEPFSKSKEMQPEIQCWRQKTLSGSFSEAQFG